MNKIYETSYIKIYLEILELKYNQVQQRGCKFANAVLEAGTLVAIKY